MDGEEVRRKVPEWDEYTKAFIQSPVYVEGVSRTLKSAGLTFRVSIWLNVALFVVALVLFGVGAIVALWRGESLQGLGFAGFGSLDLVILFWSKPLDRIQNAMTSLTQAQIASFGFMTQHDSLAKTLIAVGKKEPVPTDEIIRLVDKVREATREAIEVLYARA